MQCFWKQIKTVQTYQYQIKYFISIAKVCNMYEYCIFFIDFQKDLIRTMDGDKCFIVVG